MPSTYAHFRFAEKVAPLLPEKAAKAVKDNPALYLIGCHGPDILFYYKAIKSNPANRLGYSMHKESAAPFFERAKAIVKQGGEPSLAYIMGFITHFALDSTCHGYVEEERKKLGITHTKLEVEFDRSLLTEDNKDAVSAKLAEHIKGKREYAEVIAPFFSLSPKEIKRALKDMHMICNLFVAPGKFKRSVVTSALGIVSNELPDQIMGYEPDPVCAESNAHMKELFDAALPIAVKLAEDFLKNCDREGLCERFNATFE